MSVMININLKVALFYVVFNLD